MSRFFLFVFLLSSVCISQAQVTEDAPQITVKAAPHIDYMMERHIQLNRRGGYVAGYRIQVYASSVLSEARKKKSVFDGRYPEFLAEIVLEEPDFKLVFGYYQDRFEAWKDMHIVLERFPGAFIRKDLISISDL